MDQRERYQDDSEKLRLAIEAYQTRMWTALPGVIKQFPSASGIGQMIADIQPTINGRVRTEQGEFQSIQLPVLLDCPVLWLGGGGVTMTFPITAGDECLVIFSSRCIDAWWQQGFVPGQAGVPVNGKQTMDPPDLRMHNLSDGFALVGVKSLPNEFTIDSVYSQLRRNDGSASISFSASDVVLDAPSVSTTNNLLAGTGWSGVFTTPTGQTVTVQSGIIINVA
jgi:hypothetical protein